MVVPGREPASLGSSQLSYDVNKSVVLRWGRREGKRRLGVACLLTSVWHRPPRRLVQ